MKKLFAAVLLLSALQSQAQTTDSKVKPSGKTTTRSEVTITRDGEKTKKLVVEINGNEVTINGKPMADFTDENVKIKMRNFEMDEAMEMLEGLNPNDIASIDIIGDNINVKGKATTVLGVITDWREGFDGAKIKTVTPKSAAADAGLKEGDIITKINEEKITTTESLQQQIRKYKADDLVTVTFLRNGAEQKVTARLKKAEPVSIIVNGMALRGAQNRRKFSMPALPPMPPMPQNKFNFDDFDLDGNFDGMQVWGSGTRQKIGLKLTDVEDTEGVKILGTEEQSAAAKAGFENGDIITEIDGVKIANTDDARKALKTDKNKNSYKVKFTRNGKQKETEIKIAKKLKTVDL
jgi:serine protease Do